jgi:hypothetical protein
MSGASSLPPRSQAMARMAEALLRTLGGGEVVLRFARVPEGDAGQLGLTDALSEDVSLSPVVVRPIPARRMSESLSSAAPLREQLTIELLFSAATVAAMVEDRQSGSAQALFDAATGVLHQGTLLRIISVECEYFGATPCLYRVRAVE